MNAQTERLALQGPEGAVEALLDQPESGVPVRGTAVIAHPHPLFGGTMDNKVVQTLSRAFVQCGWTALRFNFRGVNGSAGHYADGIGEVDDMLAVVQQAAPEGALALAGFSFGAHVASHAVARLVAQRPISKLVLVGTAAARFEVAPIAPDLHLQTLVLHGEDDDTVALADVMAWARAQSLAVTVIPGCGHFFHGQLPLLKSLVVRHLSF